jgi:hypothetical protein
MPTTITIDTIHIDQVVLTAPAAPSLRWHVGPVQATTGGTMPIEVTLTTEEKCRLAITPVTAGGQPAQVDGEAQWSVEGTCTIEPIDETSAWVVAGAMGDSTVTVGVDADLGAGVVPIGDTALIHVNNPQAASVGLAADAPMLKNEEPV